MLVAASFLSPILPGQINIALAQNTTLWGFSFGGFVSSILAQLAQLIFSAVAWIVAQIGSLLDFTIEKMVLNMADIVEEISAIDALWSTFRDLGNIVFIGVLLYIAIRTILNVGNNFNTKRILIRLVIVALFVNFSLFATKVVIDTSNVVALQFYNSIQVEDCGEENGCNISHFFADVTNISSVQSPAAIEAIENGGSTEDANFKILIARILGIVFLSVTGFVMAAMAFLLLVRFMFLILLMIASPLAFIAFVLPSTSKMGEKWVQALFNQSFFAPILFAMIYIVAVLGLELASGLGGGGDLMAAILDPDGDNYGVIITFVLMTVLMAYTLVVAKEIGGEATAKSMELGVKARNWGGAKISGAAAAAGRSSIGLGGNAISESRGLKDAAKEGGMRGFGARAALKLSNKAANSSFDARNTRAGKAAGVDDKKQRSGGFREVLEKKKEKREEEKKQIERLSPAEKAKAERAKIIKEKVDKNKEKTDKRIDQEQKEASTDYNDRKDQLQNWYDNTKNAMQNAEKKTDADLSNVVDELKQVSTAINQRNELEDKLNQARAEDDENMINHFSERLSQLADNTDGVNNISELNNLENRQTSLKNKKSDLKEQKNNQQNNRNTVQNTYNDKKEQIRDQYVQERDSLKEQKKQVRELSKSRKNKLDEMIEIGDKRGEEFVQTMLEQESKLDSINSLIEKGIKKATGKSIRIPGSTKQTKASRDLGLDNVGDIKNRYSDKQSTDPTPKERASGKLRNIHKNT